MSNNPNAERMKIEVLKLKTTTIVPPCRCPNCRRVIEMASSRRDDTSPSPGDVSVCIYCGWLMVFDAGLLLRTPTDAQVAELRKDRAKWGQIVRLQKKFRAAEWAGAFRVRRKE